MASDPLSCGEKFSDFIASENPKKTDLENPLLGAVDPGQASCSTAPINPTTTSNSSECTGEDPIQAIDKQISENIFKYSAVDGSFHVPESDPNKSASQLPPSCSVNDLSSGSVADQHGATKGAVQPPPSDPSHPAPVTKSFRDAIAPEPVVEVPFGSVDFSGGTPTAVFTKEECDAVSEYYKYALIGKFTYGKPTNQVISEQLRSEGFGICKVHFLNGKHVLINLTCQSLCDKLWLKREHSFAGFPMRLFKWSPTFGFRHEPAVVPIWIKIHNLPAQWFDLRSLRTIGRLVGNFVKDGENFIMVGKPRNFTKSGSSNRDIHPARFTSNSFDVLSAEQEPDADNGGAGVDIENVNNHQASPVGNNGTSNPDSPKAIEDSMDLDTGGIGTFLVPPATNHECSTSSDNLFDVQVVEDQQLEGADLAQEQTEDARDTVSESNDDFDVDTGGGSDRSVHSTNSPKKHSFSDEGEIGDNNFFKREMLKRKHNFNILALIEPKVDLDSSFFLRKFGFDNVVANLSNHIWLFSSSDAKISILKNTKQMLHVEVCFNSLPNAFYLTVVYGRNTKIERRDLWDDLLSVNQNHSPWMVGGDFNIILHPEEKKGGADPIQSDMEEFNNSLMNCALTDGGFVGSPYTWYRDGVWQRLDRVLISSEWHTSFPFTAITHLPKCKSDHNSILCKFSPFSSKQKNSFRFQNMWIKHHNFIPTVRESWDLYCNSRGMVRLLEKLNRLKYTLKEWNILDFGNIFNKIENAQYAVEKGDPLSPLLFVVAVDYFSR
ncbi:hypothetical protein OROMI_021775 [Orobanche minor]